MSFWRTYYHIIWCTHNHEPSITPELELRLFAYLVKQAAKMGAYVYQINGWFDHIHLIVAIPPKIAVADFVKQLKGSSSHDLELAGFPLTWARGYGVLTVGERHRPVAEAYVTQQKTHHQQQTLIHWLERTGEFNEGPEDADLKASTSPLSLRESAPAYLLDEAAPF